MSSVGNLMSSVEDLMSSIKDPISSIEDYSFLMICSSLSLVYICIPGLKYTHQWYMFCISEIPNTLKDKRKSYLPANFLKSNSKIMRNMCIL